jgi:hypothetical protein
MQQFTAAWDVHPVAPADKLQIWIKHASQPELDCVLREITPSDDIDLYFNCVVPFTWGFNTIIEVSFPNTDDNDVGVWMHLLKVDSFKNLSW